MANYKDKIRDFAKRTQKNMEIIEELHNEGRKVYEVTHFINSLLGLLVFPQQSTIIPTTSLETLKKEGWPIPSPIRPYPPARTLDYLLRKMRNSISHQHIEYKSDKNGEIVSLILWDELNGRTNWKVTMSVDDFKQFTYRFVQLFQTI